MITETAKTYMVSYKGIDVPVYVYGNESKPLIFFLHGYPHVFSQYIGDLPITYLKENFCIAAFDLFFEQKSISFSDLISHIHNTLFPSRDVILFGASFGGAIALQCADISWVKGIIVAGTPYFSFLSYLFLYFAALFLAKANYQLSTVINTLTFLRKDNLAHIQKPVLLLYGTKDRIAPFRMGKKLLQILPNAKLFPIPDLPHNWLLHRIDQNGILEHMTVFIDKIEEDKTQQE